MAERDKELQLLEKRFAELADRALAAESVCFYRLFIAGRAGGALEKRCKGGSTYRIIRRNGWCRAVYGQVRRSGGIRI